MPNIAEFKESKFITRADVEPAALFTILGCEKLNVAKEGMKPEYRYALHLQETEKPFICNSTNAQIIAGFTKLDNTDDWPGHKIVLYFDPNVSYAGKLTGGIRARAPQNRAGAPVGQRPTATPPPVAPLADQDVPF